MTKAAGNIAFAIAWLTKHTSSANH